MNSPRFSRPSMLSLFLALGLAPAVWAQSLLLPASSAEHERATATINKLPLRFEPTDREGVFLARSAGQAVQLTGTSIDFPLGSGTERGDSIRLQFVGARKSSQVTGVDQLPGHVNYLLGDDRSRWRTNVPTYGRARTKSLYRGIDIEYYGAADLLEYDLIVRPRAQPESIRLAISGVDAGITKSGDLTYGDDHRTLLRKPIAYQTIDGIRSEVAAEYRQRADGTVQFTLGPYDRDRTLVIDPVVVYSFAFGGSDDDRVQDITVDDAGAVYLSGYTSSPDFPTVRAYQPVSGLTCQATRPCTDGFLVKIRPDGGSLEYATYFSTGPSTTIEHIAVDASHAVCFSGDGAWIYGPPDPFIAKLSPSGTQLLYLFAPPTPVKDLAVADDGSVYVATATGVAALSPSGSNFHTIFDVLSGRSPSDVPAATTFTTIAVAAGSVFAAGNTSWAAFPTTPGASQTNHHSHLMWKIRDAGAEPASDQGLEDWNQVTQLAVSPADPNVRYAATMNSLTGWGQIARSTDGGTTWARLKMPAIRVPRIVLAYHDPLAVYVFSSQDGLWKTTDGGSTFTSLPFAGAVGGLFISSDDSTLYLVGESLTGVSKSVNGGMTWTPLPWPSDFLFETIDSRIPARLYAHQIRGSLMRTADEGVTWQPIAAEGNLAVSQSVPTTMYDATSVGPSLRKSTDDGLTWRTVLTAPSVVFAAVHPAAPDIVVVLTNSDWRRSTDGGATWTTLPRVVPWAALVFDPSDSNVVLGHTSRLADAFVIRMTQQGVVLYSTLLGGTLVDSVADIVVDAEGAAHVVGDTSSQDFPSTRPATWNPYAPYHTFLTKLSPDGGSILYARQLGKESAHETGAAGIGLQVGLDHEGHARTAACSKPDIDFPSWNNDCRTYLVSVGGTLLESTSIGDPPPPLLAVDQSGSFYFVTNASRVGEHIGVTKYAEASPTVLSLTANIPLPVHFGTPTSWTSSAFSADSAEYSFWHFSLTHGWEQLQDFSPSRSVTWTPASWDIGDNVIRVYARAIGSTEPPVQASASFAVLGVQPGEPPVLPSAADFNADFRPDLLWLNNANGKLAMWNLGGGTHGERVLDGGYLNAPPLPAGWRTAGAADIDADGQTDLVVQSDTGQLGAWLFNGSNLRGGVLLSPSQVTDPNWHIRAVGDLNRDGHPDLIWQYAPTGQVAFWLMNGTSAIGYVIPDVAAPGADWEIIGTGDANRDGERDLFWQQRSTGALAVWLMNGTALTGGTLLAVNPGTAWRAVAVSDLDGNAYSDIVLQNTTTGDVGAWYLMGGALKFGVMLVPSSVGAGWSLVGPR